MSEVEAGHGIVVGVTAAGENTAALRWAARESRIRGLEVALVHVVEPFLPPPPPSLLLGYPDLVEIGEQLVAEVAEEYADIAGPVEHAPRCSPLVERGHAASVLVDLSRDAELVVVAHRHLPDLQRLFTGSVAVSVAAHAHCPVVSVPRTWEPPLDYAGQYVEGVPAAGWVTIGLHEPGPSEDVLAAGFAAAAAHGWGVRLLHAWRMDPEYDDILSARLDDHWAERTAKELHTVAEPLTVRYPGVRLQVEVKYARPADALLEASHSSDLLVVGRHGKRPLLPQRIGSMARTMLRAAACPVLVVPV